MTTQDIDYKHLLKAMNLTLNQKQLLTRLCLEPTAHPYSAKFRSGSGYNLTPGGARSALKGLQEKRLIIKDKSGVWRLRNDGMQAWYYALQSNRPREVVEGLRIGPWEQETEGPPEAASEDDEHQAVEKFKALMKKYAGKLGFVGDNKYDFRIKIRSLEGSREELAELFKRIDQGEFPEKPCERIEFEDTEEFFRFFTPQRLEILETLCKHGMMNITNITEALNRNRVDLREDLKILVQMGFVIKKRNNLYSLRKALEENWLAQNKAAIEEYNQFIETHGCFSDKFRRF